MIGTGRARVEIDRGLDETKHVLKALGFHRCRRIRRGWLRDTAGCWLDRFNGRCLALLAGGGDLDQGGRWYANFCDAGTVRFEVGEKLVVVLGVGVTIRRGFDEGRTREAR